MADVNSDVNSDIEQNYSLTNNDPKNIQELTLYVSKYSRSEEVRRSID